jgi:tetratricopeptide (TPR) repeat protein
MAMTPLGPPDSFHWSAAAGWLELGNPAEAARELASVAPALSNHPDVLEVRWQIEAATEDWERCQASAGALIKAEPGRSSGWILLAYALRRVAGGGLQSAWDVLVAAADRFPKEPLIAYNLACYACQLGRPEEAWQWLESALALGNSQKVKNLALADPDLRALWPRLRAL